MKRLFYYSFVLLLNLIFIKQSVAQPNAHKFEELDVLQSKEQRNIVIFIHTDWCKFCQTMKNTTLKNDSIISILNKHYYFAELDGEEKNDIVFNEHTFRYKPTGVNTGIHELAEQLGSINGQVSYPVICILNTKNEVVFKYNQFLNATDFLYILKRFYE